VEEHIIYPSKSLEQDIVVPRFGGVSMTLLLLRMFGWASELPISAFIADLADF
jgi:hypothetical protein